MFPDNPDNKKVQWDITNDGGSAIITQIDIAWPGASWALGLINFGEARIWEGLLEPPPPLRTISESSLGDQTARTIIFGETKTLEFQFESDTGAAGQYSITVTFDNGCTVSLLSTGTAIAWDNFETEDWSGGVGWLGAWSHTGEASVTKLGHPHGGDWHLKLEGGDSTEQGYAKRALNLSSKSNVHLQFYAKAKLFESSDNAKCIISHNGTDWDTVREWVDGDDDNNYHFYHIDLSSYSKSSEFWIAFDANMNLVSEHLYVDDLSVIEVVP